MLNKKDLPLTFLVLFGAVTVGVSAYYWGASGTNANEIAQAAAHSHSHEEGEEEENTVKLTEEQIQKLGLKFLTVGPGTLNHTLSTRGKIILHPDRLAHIVPKVSGVAQEADKNIGNPVKANEVMAVLESRDMADIKAAFLAALSRKKLAESTLQREEKLYRDNVSSGADYLNAKNNYEESVINAQLSFQKLRAFGLDEEDIQRLVNQNEPDLRSYQIRSPIDGTVIMRHITKGEFVESTSTIYEVADLSTVWVEIGIYPKDLHRVREGQMIEVMIPSESKGSPAQLIYVSPIVADETITAKAVAQLNNPEGKWRPGVFVKVNIATEKSSSPLVVVNEAIQSGEGKDFVFVVVPEGFERRFVKLGRSDNQFTEIVSGLNSGENYVANQTFLLKAELGKNSAEHEH